MESVDRKQGKKRSGLGRRTCLYCFHPFRIERGSAPCPACGEAQSKAQQDRFWTLRPNAKFIQATARVGGIGVMLIFAAVVGYHADLDGTSLFWGGGLLSVAGWFIWETGGLITRRESALPLGILWPAILLCIAFGPIVFSMLLKFIGGQGEEGMGWLVALQWAGPWIGAFGMSLMAPKWLRIYKEACLRSGDSD